MKPGTLQTGHSRGVALVTTLLLLSMFMVMTLAMVIAVNSDTLINGYYRNFRGAFYASDSGLNAARQYLLSQVATLTVPTGYSPSSTTAPSSPLSASNYSSIVGGLTNTSTGFGSYQSVDGSQSSWPASFKVDSTNTYITYSGLTTPSPITTGATTTYTFQYPYKITVIGKSGGSEQNTVSEEGYFTVPVVVTSTSTSGTKSSFAAWGTFLNSYGICGSPFVTGTMSGPFFSNDSFNFGDTGLVGNGSYIFTGSVSTANPNVGYMYTDGTCHQSSATSDSETVTTTSGFGRHQTTTTTTTTIAPQFQGGLYTNQSALPVPSDSYSQAQAVLDGIGLEPTDCGSSSTCPTASDMAADHLTNAAGTLWPATGSQPTSGVYMAYTSTGTGCPCMTGGGIYVQGNADSVVLSAATASNGDSQQVFTIKQGTTTTTVTVDLTAQTTTFSDNKGNSKTLSGVPENRSGSTASEAAILYVNGAISGTSSGTTTGLSGPSSGAAIPNGSAVNVTATGNIAITGNILYAKEPVTLSQSGSTPADTAISPAPTNVLGIYTSGGDIQIQPTSNVSTMEIDASLSMVGASSSGGLIAQWNTVGTLNIVGGRIAMQAKSGASLGQRNIYFDKRFGSGGFAPPWYPSTTVGTSTVTTSSAAMGSITYKRTNWINTTAE